jgi:hypothetical protein
MSRTANVVRMQLINRQTYIWVPLIVLGGAFVLSLAIWLILSSSGVEGSFYGGGSQAPLWYFGVVGVQALTLTFPFSQAMSVTRREFFFGTALTAIGSAVLLALVFVVGGLLEEATNGWGVGGYFFALPWVWEQGIAVAALFYFVVAMNFFMVGFCSATIYKRFGSVILTTILIGVGALLVAGMFFVGRANAWQALFTWFATQGALGLSLWGALLAAVLAGIAYLVLRRATP